jgi:hypothetical protein
MTSPQHIKKLKKFFERYGTNGEEYILGDICYDWQPNNPNPPPWQTDPDTEWDQAHATQWQTHCRTDLDVPNTDDNGTPTGNKVMEDLTIWIREAILAEKRVVYRFRRNGTWRAKRSAQGNHWRIEVYGPGFA